MARTCENCGIKTCRVCGAERPATEFQERLSRSGEHGHRNECHDCRRAFNKANYEAKKDVWRNANLLKMYGITLAEYDAMYDAQNGCCIICGDHYPRRGSGSKGNDVLHVDHCHRTLLVRALICHGCNTGLGGFKDSPELLLAAAAWLIQMEGVPHGSEV